MLDAKNANEWEVAMLKGLTNAYELGTQRVGMKEFSLLGVVLGGDVRASDKISDDGLNGLANVKSSN